MARRRFVLGNWKMHQLRQDAEKFAKELSSLLSDYSLGDDDFVGVAPAVPCIGVVDQLSDQFSFHFLTGAQNVHWEDKGAFTGEHSIPMLQECGARFIIVGHSERRTLFRESDEEIAKKVEAISRAKLLPVLCVGESLEQREKNQTEQVLKEQVMKGLSLVKSVQRVVIAYEPVWAIGSGKSAGVDEVLAAHGVIRQMLEEIYSASVAESSSILYGGSVKADNARDFGLIEGVDGLLVGGASLNAKSFADIVVRFYQVD